MSYDCVGGGLKLKTKSKSKSSSSGSSASKSGGSNAAASARSTEIIQTAGSTENNVETAAKCTGGSP